MTLTHRTLSRRSIWQRAAVAFVGAAVPALALPERDVSANQSGTTVNDDSQWQIAICEAGGGHGAVVDVVRLPDWSVQSMATKCNGGYFDGVFCWNSKLFGISCSKNKAASAPAPGDIPPLSFTQNPPPGLTAALEHMLHATPVDETPPALAPDHSVSAPPVDTDAGGGPRRRRGKGKGKGRGKRRR